MEQDSSILFPLELCILALTARILLKLLSWKYFKQVYFSFPPFPINMFTLHPKPKLIAPEKNISGSFKKAGHKIGKRWYRRSSHKTWNGSKEILAGRRKTLSTESRSQAWVREGSIKSLVKSAQLLKTEECFILISIWDSRKSSLQGASASAWNGHSKKEIVVWLVRWCFWLSLGSHVV